MSTRQLLTKTTGALAVLTVLALVAVVVTWSPGGDNAAAAALAVRQQGLVTDMDRQLEQLVSAEDFAAVNEARSGLGRTVLDFDRNLAILVNGGTVAGERGRPVRVPAVKGETARRALSGASSIWLQVGMPLSDLAAGEFSVFSAAGQQAAAGLRANTAELSSHLATTAAACTGDGAGTGRNAMVARLLAGACLLALAGSLALRRRPARDGAPAAPAPRVGLAPAGAVSRWTAVADNPPPRTAPPPRGFKSPVDFEDVSASVDQMTVDMSTIAASTEKMRAAIDSVGVALQGMIYSLNDLGDDTAEGYRLVRGANNAAGYTRQVAAELAENVREMGNVVSRVTQLAQKCRQTAATIDQEAAQAGRRGGAINEAVAGQVKALAAQTSNATAEVEQTVSAMLARTRDYEEAVGQILKHVSAIHRVSQNLGQVVLDPPQAAVVGEPRAQVRAPEAYTAPAPEPAALAREPEEAPEPTPVEVAAETAAAIEDAAGPAAPDAPAFDPESDEMPAFEKPKVKFSLDSHGADTPPPPAPPAIAEPTAPASGRTSVFMLNRPKAPETAQDLPDIPAPPAAGTPAAPPAPEPLPEPATSFEASLESAVEEPAADGTPDEAVDDPGSEPAVSAGPRPNIFMLNDPTRTPKPRIGV